MKRTWIRRTPAKVSPEHKAATALAARSSCLLCRVIGCVPAHFGRDGRSGHRGMGGAKAGWARSEWVPLCREHHDYLDWRTGGVSEEACAKREECRAIVLQRAIEEWWPEGER